MTTFKELLEQRVSTEVLQREFPNLYPFLENCDEEVKKRQSKFTSKNDYFTELSDLLYLAYIYYDTATNQLKGKMIVSMTSTYSGGAAVVSIFDKNKLLVKQETISVSEESVGKTRYKEYSFLYDFSKRKLTDCFYIQINAVLIGRQAQEQKEFDFNKTCYKIENIYNDVGEINAPRKLELGKSETINVFYKRYPNLSDFDVDYVYDKAELPDGRIDISLPLKGKVILKDGCQFGCYGTEDWIHQAIIDFKKGGIFYSNLDNFGRLLSDNQVLEWDFLEKWNGSLRQGVFNPNNDCELTMQMRYCLFNSSLKSTFFASSLIENDIFYGCKNMRKLKLCLGCVAEGTKVLMADGSEKPIETIKEGESISCGENNLEGIVACVWKGTEEFLVCIELVNGRILKITGNHMILTDQGMIQACQLNGENRIMTFHDGLVPIKSLYEIPYNKIVYNLDVIKQDGKHGNMVCEDIVVTDNFNLPTNGIKSKENICHILSDDEMELNIEIKKMIKYINSLPL